MPAQACEVRAGRLADVDAGGDRGGKLNQSKPQPDPAREGIPLDQAVLLERCQQNRQRALGDVQFPAQLRRAHPGLVWAVCLVRAERTEQAGSAINRRDQRTVLVFSHED